MSKPFPWYVGLRFFSAGSDSRLVSFISALAISGLILGVAVLVVVLSVMNGFDREMRTRILTWVPHIQLTSADGVADWQIRAGQLASHPHVLSVSPFTQIEGLLVFRGKSEAVQLRGERTGEGRSVIDAPSVARPEPGRDEIWLPRLLAEKLGVEPGKQITFMTPRRDADAAGRSVGRTLPEIRVLTVGGLYSTRTALDNHVALVHIETASALANLKGRPQGLKVTVNDVFLARETGFQLLDQLPPQYYFIDWIQTHGNLYQAIQMSRKLVGLMVFLIVSIAAFNVVAMLVMTVVDKQGDIAVLKTLGADGADILRVFLIQGALIGLLGTLCGAGLGYAVAFFIPELIDAIERFFDVRFLNVDVYPIDFLPSDPRISDVLWVSALGWMLTMVATIYPALRAARVKPAEVLRYE